MPRSEHKSGPLQRQSPIRSIALHALGRYARKCAGIRTCLLAIGAGIILGLGSLLLHLDNSDSELLIGEWIIDGGVASPYLLVLDEPNVYYHVFAHDWVAYCQRGKTGEIGFAASRGGWRLHRGVLVLREDGLSTTAMLRATVLGSHIRGQYAYFHVIACDEYHLTVKSAPPSELAGTREIWPRWVPAKLQLAPRPSEGGASDCLRQNKGKHGASVGRSCRK